MFDAGDHPLNALRTGQILIDRYEIQRYINAGGMQEVYECFDKHLDRVAVVKTPKPGVQDKRFKRGAEMSARINHHNIAATFDYFEVSNATYMVEEYVAGLDLAQRLDNEFEFMDPALAAHVIHNIARALYEAHRAGICHRDLKPSNIMTSPDPGLATIKLTDFGIAKLAEGEIAAEMQQFNRDQSTLTNSSTLLGAVPYLAPECWANWRKAGQPMDIWALGCIAYQLLTGDPPFGYGPQAIRAVMMAEQAGKPTLLQPKQFGRNVGAADLEGELFQLILDCLAIDTDQRPTAAQILERCGTWCYGAAEREYGSISAHGTPYARTGYILLNRGAHCFFHDSEYLGPHPIRVGTPVNVSVYPGSPLGRAAPVLALKPPRP